MRKLSFALWGAGVSQSQFPYEDFFHLVLNILLFRIYMNSNKPAEDDQIICFKENNITHTHKNFKVLTDIY